MNKFKKAQKSVQHTDNSVKKYSKKKNTSPFIEFINYLKSENKDRNDAHLYELLYDGGLFEELLEKTKATNTELRYLFDKIDNHYELDALFTNPFLVERMTELCSFQEVINKFKSTDTGHKTSCFYELFEHTEVLDRFFKQNKITLKDLKYLLDQVEDWYELQKLCRNTILLKKILYEFLLNNDLVTKFEALLENNDQCKYYEIYSVFDMIAYQNKNNEEILKLNDLNKVYLVNSFDLSIDQKLELIEILKDNEIAQNRLKDVVNNHLELNYDFESLMSYLKKVEKKSILNI